MQIDLFENTKLVRESSKSLGLLRKKGFEVEEDLSYYEKEVATSLEEDFHIKSVLSGKDAHERSYQEFQGKISDPLIEVEKLGVCRYAKVYTTIISLEDSLDYILHRICGASIEAVRNIRGYETLSRSLLKFNFDGLSGFTVDDLCGVDPKLDKFIAGLVKDEPEQTDDVALEFLLNLVKEVILEASSIAEYVGFYYDGMQPAGTSVIRSKSFCSFVLTTSDKHDGEIVLRSPGYDNYTLKVHSFAKKEYSKKLNLRYAE